MIAVTFWRRQREPMIAHAELERLWADEDRRNGDRLAEIERSVGQIKRGANPFANAVTHRDQETPE